MLWLTNGAKYYDNDSHLLLDRLHHSGGLMVNTWPFPSKDNPLTPWTPEEQQKYNDEQRQQVPDAPMVLGLV